MTITLTIDNLDAMPDGGPVRYQANCHGFEVGREQHLDWTLPDPERYISGRHCEFRYENDAYWLYDVSSNGTFVNGSPNRVKSPYRLAHGDRLSIGHYIIRVELEGDAASVAPAHPQQAHSPQPSQVAEPGGSAYEDIWDTGAESPPPADRRDFMPERESHRAPDFSAQFLDFPDVQEPSPQQHASSQHPSSTQEPLGTEHARGGEGYVEQQTGPTSESPFGAGTGRAPARRPMPQSSPAPARQQASADASAYAVLEALAKGAGVPVEAFIDRDEPQAVAYEIGQVLRIVVDNLAQLLKARAAAKTMTKTANRTMIGAADNNPLKFVPAAADAIEIMFSRNRTGYMGAQQSFEAAFSDLKSHELATYAAMQKALARLLDDLGPDAIEADVKNSALPLRKGRAWDQFVKRWDEKNDSPNGILDVFLVYFAEAYDEAGRQGN